MDEVAYYCGPMNTIHKVFFLDTLEKLMKDWTVGSYLVLESNSTFYGGITLMAIGYKYSSSKILVFIDTEGAGSNEPGGPYLSRFHDIYSNVFVCPVVYHYLIGRYINACNALDNHNSMRQSNLAPGKYWVTRSGYSRLATTVALGMGITDGKLLFFHFV